MLSKLLAFLHMAKPGRKPKPDCDSSGNSEESLIALLKSILVNEFKSVNDAIQEFRTELAAKETKDNERHNAMATAIETLTASVDANVAGQADLTTAVNALIVRIGTPGPTDAQLLTLAGQIDSSTASDKALTDAANAALATPPPAP